MKIVKILSYVVVNATVEISRENLRSVEAFFLESTSDLIRAHIDLTYYSYLWHASNGPDLRYFDIRLRELLRALSLTDLLKGDIPFSPEVDQIWHLMILETKKYREFCQKFCGHFIDHRSRKIKNIEAQYAQSSQREEPSLEAKNQLRNSVIWLQTYIEKFGEIRPESVDCWPVFKELSQDLNLDFQKTNEILKKAQGHNIS